MARAEDSAYGGALFLAAVTATYKKMRLSIIEELEKPHKGRCLHTRSCEKKKKEKEDMICRRQMLTLQKRQSSGLGIIMIVL